MSYGFVYVLANDAMPGIYKIGMTERAPRARVDELSKATAVPLPFDLLMYGQVEDAREAEAEVHSYLAGHRVNDSREFFRVDDLELLDELIHSVALDVCYVEFHPLKWAKAHEARERFLTEHFLSQCHDPIHWQKHRGFPDD